MSRRAELVQIIEELAGTLPRTPGGLLATLTNGILTRWDTTLTPVERHPTPLPDTARLLDATADAIAAASPDHLWIHTTANADPIRVPVPADSAAFLTPDRLLVTAPSPWRPGRGFAESHRILLLDHTGNILADTSIAVDDATPHLLRHPSEPAVVCDFAMGQDGNTLTVIRGDGDELTVREIFHAEEFVDLAFDPTGTRLLLGPYPTDPSRVVVAGWPDLEIRDELTAESIGLTQGFDLTGGHLDDDHILLLATEQGPVLSDSTLTDAALLDLADVRTWAGPDGFVESVAPLSTDLFAAVLWENGHRTTTVWQIDHPR